jgi:hypothetical protein
VTTQTLKEADRYLLTRGLAIKHETLLDKGYQARYQVGRMEKKKTDDGITITLHDYGDGHWTSALVAHSNNREKEALEVMRALSLLPGYEPHRV